MSQNLRNSYFLAIALALKYYFCGQYRYLLSYLYFRNWCFCLKQCWLIVLSISFTVHYICNCYWGNNLKIKIAQNYFYLAQIWLFPHLLRSEFCAWEFSISYSLNEMAINYINLVFAYFSYPLWEIQTLYLN